MTFLLRFACLMFFMLLSGCGNEQSAVVSRAEEQQQLAENAALERTRVKKRLEGLLSTLAAKQREAEQKAKASALEVAEREKMLGSLQRRFQVANATIRKQNQLRESTNLAIEKESTQLDTTYRRLKEQLASIKKESASLEYQSFFHIGYRDAERGALANEYYLRQSIEDPGDSAARGYRDGYHCGLSDRLQDLR